MTATLSSIVGGASPESRASAVEFLRTMADDVESGKCTDFVMLCVLDERFHWRRWASKMNAVCMTAMAHSEALREMRE